MRRTALAVAALFFAAHAFAAGSFVTRTVQGGAGTYTTQFYDMSGTGIGPFLPASVCADGAGNLCATGSGGAYTGASATAPGTSGPTATPVQGVAGGVPLAVTWSGQTVGISGSVAVTGTFFQATQPVSQTDGASVTIGAKADAASAATGGSLMAIARQLHADLLAPAVLPAGTNTIGKVGIDQTTPGTTNGVAVASIGANAVAAGAGASNTGTQRVVLSTDSRPTVDQGSPQAAVNAWPSAVTGVATASFGIVPTATAAVASSQVLKASAGNLYGLNVVAGASAGFIMLFDATTAPADGAVTPKWVMPLAANAAYAGSPSGNDIGMNFAVGIVAVFSTTGPFTKTASATAFISGMAR